MKVLNERIIEVKADNFRRNCGIALDAAIDFEKLLVSLDVLTVFKPLEGDFSGMAVKTKNNKFMMVNSQNQLGRQQFTIGHELYHLFEQEDFTFQLCKTGVFDKKHPEEYNADNFSSYLLMPEPGIMKHIPEKELGWGSNISLTTIIKLEQYFKVSRRALLVRLSKMKLINFIEYEHYLTNVIKSAKEHGYSDSLYKPSSHEKIIGNYGVKAKELFDNGKISESHYHSLMMDIGINLDAKIEEYGEEIY